MTVEFDLPPPLRALRLQVRAFVEAHVIPSEATVLAEDRTGSRACLDALRARARREGLFAPHLPTDLGGLGLGIMGMCALFREMGRSPIGAKVFNCDAPDQGNMDLLLSAGSEAQKARYLGPLARGEITSAFCMTEPAPGAGADPSNLSTRAARVQGGWRISGRKWFSTGGENAAFLVVMARTSDDEKNGATMFIVDRSLPGVEHIRNVSVMAPDLLDHREAEITFRDVFVGDDAVLRGAGEGFRLAQARLVPARLTHCMRWLGLADRTLQMCREYLSTRMSFGRVLAEHQMMQKLVAENAIAIHAGNLMTLHCAWMLERGESKTARPYSSMAKNHVAKLLCKVLDDAIQMHGAKGYSDDLPFARWYCSARAARIADGPDEVHIALIAREVLKGRLDLLI